VHANLAASCLEVYAAVQGNPFCLQPAYLAAVQQALPCLQRFDGKTVCWSKHTAAMQSTDTPAKTSSLAADSTDATSAGLQLQVCFSQLSVQNTVPGRLPALDAANEPVPPLYYYYLQLRTADGSLLCSFPIVLSPQEELAQWQAHQAAEPAAASKKAAKKAPAGKGGKADANAADQRNAWYPEVNKAEQMRSNPCVDLDEIYCMMLLICAHVSCRSDRAVQSTYICCLILQLYPMA